MATHQSKAQRETVSRVMHEFKHGELESSTGQKVRNPKQAIAIGRRFKIREQDQKPRKSEADQGARTTRCNREGSERANRRSADAGRALCGGEAAKHSKTFEDEQKRTRTRFASIA